jgi:hypothetical protein
MNTDTVDIIKTLPKPPIKKIIKVKEFSELLSNTSELSNLVTKITKDNKWKSSSRIIGEACEEYIKSNIECFRCKTKIFNKCKTNEKSKDIICFNCNQNYQIKAKMSNSKEITKIRTDKVFKTLGGEYSTTLANLNQSIDYIILLYEKQTYSILDILYVKNEDIDESCFIPRKRLSESAKRTGWQGCYIVFNNIEFININ